MDFTGLNSSFSIEEYFIEKDIVDASNKTYISVLNKKRGYKSWLKHHKLMRSLNNNLKIYYATFTFDNIHLNRLKMNSFIKYLLRNGVKAYRLNYDIGDLNERLHLHGFIVVDKKINNLTFNLYGFTKMVLMDVKEEEDEEKIINYIVNYVIKNNFFSNKVFTKWKTSLYN